MSVVLSLFVLLYNTNFLKKLLNSIIIKKKKNLVTVEFVCHKHITPLSTTMKGWSI